MKKSSFLESARQVLSIESTAVAAQIEHLDHTFEQACESILACEGRVVVTGMGKSGHIANKLAATLASTGTPAFFVHPGEASHGDLGMITPKDLVLAISNSGETGEVLAILPIIKRMGVPLIGMASAPESTLARLSDVYLNVPVAQEACPMNLAPTASTTASLAMGDALAIAVLNARDFNEQDFARSHPGGSLGRRLLLYVEDIMHKGDEVPLVSDTALLSDALVEMSGKGLGMTGVIDATDKLVGIYTDGDLRRTLAKRLSIDTPINAVMTSAPTTTTPNTLAAELVSVMKTKRISGVLVVDNDTVVGAVNMQDLLRAGVL
ncbi:arabinose 5-phosphate isomerase [Arenicella chitinivorans]|uniref:Arabinose 5-phosphate isomerase n=1 Tax=Arenicella chitinivorans TaxID=1329800 RepID=A0A918RNC7_9GAMM|nr:KpsF/GutQ family sugar-phosphate isomerase [Arenicella chitinivorans]GHA04195.1 arabinose 5-phosphate isomerase [Arenicella chitinivorans]